MLERAGAEVFTGTVRKYLSMLGQGKLTLRQKRDLITYVSMNARLLLAAMPWNAEILRIVTEQRRITLKYAQQLLAECVDTECRVLLLNFINTNGGLAEADSSLEL